MVVAGVKVRVSAVLDLCDRRVRRRLKVTLTDLARPWWPVQETGGEALTQAIGRAAYEAGFEAVMMPSARHPGGTNLNVFPDKLRMDSCLGVSNEKDLRKYLR